MTSAGVQKGTFRRKRASEGCGTIIQGTKSSSSISSFFSRAPAAAFFPFSAALDAVCSVFSFTSLLVPTVKLENDTILAMSPREEKKKCNESPKGKEIRAHEDVPTASFTF